MTHDQEARDLAEKETLEQLTTRLSDAAATYAAAKSEASRASAAECDARNAANAARARVETLKSAVNLKLESL